MFDIDRVSKTVWFFLPIAISLFVNLVMFIVTSIELCRLDYHVRKRRQLQLQVKETRRQMLERYELFVFLLRNIWSLIMLKIFNIFQKKSIFYILNFRIRFLVFIKLSFGMGLIWTMEIVSGVLGDDVDEVKW